MLNAARPGDAEITNEDKLQFYGMFKQATAGPNNTKAPSRRKIVERYKWDSWKKLGSISKEEAMKKYVEKLSKLDPKWDVPKPKL